MAPVKNRFDSPRTSVATLDPPENAIGSDDEIDLTNFDDEMKRLTAANQELLQEFSPHHEPEATAPAEAAEVRRLRLENAELKARIEELEALGAGNGEQLWRERQREYEALLEEKSEVIRDLHQRMQEMQETVGLGDAPPPSTHVSGSRLGQAEEILRLKRELEEQRKQLEQDEVDMMAQMRQMEMTMAKERAEMARHRQEVQRLKTELDREIENSNRDPELRERLNTLRRCSDPRPVAPTDATASSTIQKSSGFFRRMFG